MQPRITCAPDRRPLGVRCEPRSRRGIIGFRRVNRQQSSINSPVLFRASPGFEGKRARTRHGVRPPCRGPVGRGRPGGPRGIEPGAFNRSPRSDGGSALNGAVATAGRTFRRFRVAIKEWATTPQAVGVVDPGVTVCRWGIRSPSLEGPPEAGPCRRGVASTPPLPAARGRGSSFRGVFGPAKAQSRRSERTS